MIGFLGFFMRPQKRSIAHGVTFIDKPGKGETSRPMPYRGGRLEGHEGLILSCHDGGRAGFRPPLEG